MNETRSFADVLPLGRALDAAPAPGSAPPHLARRADFQLGSSWIRPAVRMVEGPGGSVAAEPRVMQVLLALVDADCGVLTRDDLIRRCWQGRIVGDDAINRAISEIRRIAREAGAEFGVETIPRIGFRLSGVEADGKPAGVPPARRSLDRRAVLAGGAAVAGAGAAGLWWASRPAKSPAAALVGEARTFAYSGTPEGDRQAIVLLERAVARWPDDADAWGLLALTRARIDEHSTELVQKAPAGVTQAAGRALQIDPDNADARAALVVAVPYYGDWSTAERRLDAILAADPQHLAARDSRSFLLASVGRMTESAATRDSLAEDAPFDANIQFRHVYSLWTAGSVDEADRVAARGIEMWPRHVGMWFARLWLLAGTGRFDRALAQIADAGARPALPPPMIALLSTAVRAADGGNAASIEAATGAVMGSVGVSIAAVVNAMMLLNLMDARDAAFALADAYYLEDGPVIAAMPWRRGQPVVPDQRRRKTNMLFVPSAAAMRRDDRFPELVRRMGLTDYWQRNGVLPDYLRA